MSNSVVVFRGLRLKSAGLPIAVAVAISLFGSKCLAADPTTPPALSADEQQQADAFDKATLLSTKESAAIAAQTALAKAKVAAATPATGDGVTAPSGAVTGANNMTFAMYMLSLEGLKRVSQALCDDLKSKGITSVFTSGKDVAEAVAKDEAFKRARDQLADKLKVATTTAKNMKSTIDGTAVAGQKISAASLTAIASGIDIAAGLVKGAAGLASLFKSERKIEASDNLLSATEVAASLTMCTTQVPGPVVVNVDGDVKTLASTIDSVSNEVKNISDLAAGLDSALNDLATSVDALDRESKKATDAKDTAKVVALTARKPINFATFSTKATSLVTTAQAYADTMYQVDPTTGLSPLIVSSQFRALRNAATVGAAKNRLVLTLLKSSGYSLTTKRLFLNDRVDYAGGVAIRASVFDQNGVAVYDRIFFRDSGWVRADFQSTGGTILHQNF